MELGWVSGALFAATGLGARSTTALLAELQGLEAPPEVGGRVQGVPVLVVDEHLPGLVLGVLGLFPLLKLVPELSGSGSVLKFCEHLCI